MDTSYLTTQVSTIIGQLHGLFDEIGVSPQEKDAREAELFAALSETLHNQLRLVTAEKAELHNEANKIIKTIKQMEASLDDSANDQYHLDDGDLKVTVPLTQCLHSLKEKHNAIAKIHRERFEQVKSMRHCFHSRNLRLTTYRTCSSPRIIFVSSRAFLRPDQASTDFKQCLAPSYIRSFSIIYQRPRQRILTCLRRIHTAYLLRQTSRRGHCQSLGRARYATSTD